ncbi:MAG TPA: NAD(P)-binding protein, partial [Actinomycetes bacterium]
MLRVAVIGSGPAGVYAAGALVQHGDVAVDVFDRLPCPFGLVRY